MNICRCIKQTTFSRKKKSLGQGLKDVSPALETLIVFPGRIKTLILQKKRQQTTTKARKSTQHGKC